VPVSARKRSYQRQHYSRDALVHDKSFGEGTEIATKRQSSSHNCSAKRLRHERGAAKERSVHGLQTALCWHKPYRFGYIYMNYMYMRMYYIYLRSRGVCKRVLPCFF